jgi:hypothetical protein
VEVVPILVGLVEQVLQEVLVVLLMRVGLLETIQELLKTEVTQRELFKQREVPLVMVQRGARVELLPQPLWQQLHLVRPQPEAQVVRVQLLTQEDSLLSITLQELLVARL